MSVITEKYNEPITRMSRKDAEEFIRIIQRNGGGVNICQFHDGRPLEHLYNTRYYKALHPYHCKDANEINLDHLGMILFHLTGHDVEFEVLPNNRFFIKLAAEKPAVDTTKIPKYGLTWKEFFLVLFGVKKRKTYIDYYFELDRWIDSNFRPSAALVKHVKS